MDNGIGDFNHVGNGDAQATSPGALNGGSVDATVEDKSISDRIAALELVVSQQADELLCLKTALADVCTYHDIGLFLLTYRTKLF